jgi:hypothetical protein
MRTCTDRLDNADTLETGNGGQGLWLKARVDALEGEDVRGVDGTQGDFHENLIARKRYRGRAGESEGERGREKRKRKRARSATTCASSPHVASQNGPAAGKSPQRSARKRYLLVAGDGHGQSREGDAAVMDLVERRDDHGRVRHG